MNVSDTMKQNGTHTRRKGPRAFGLARTNPKSRFVVPHHVEWRKKVLRILPTSQRGNDGLKTNTGTPPSSPS